MKCKGRSRSNFGTPAKTASGTSEGHWAILPFTEATWRLTYWVRAVTSANDVDPRVQEVLDLPVLSVAAAQDEDLNLIFMRELLKDHDVRPSWDTVILVSK